MRARNNKGNVFVGNLPPDFPDERLAETFDPYGIVLSAAVARDPDLSDRTALRLRDWRSNEHLLRGGHGKKCRHHDQDQVPAPRLALPYFGHSSRLPFGTPFPRAPYPSASGGRLRSILLGRTPKARTTLPFHSASRWSIGSGPRIL